MSAITTWKCEVCGYVHEGSEPPATCPVCGVEREMFAPLEAVAPAAADAETAGAGAGSGDIHRIVIVGGGIAGLTAAEHARRTDPGVAITLVTGEAGLPYYRLNLTRYLAGEVDEPELDLRPEGWFDEQGIDLVQAEVRGIDRYGRRVELGAVRGLPYDRLVLATGAQAFVPPIPGTDLTGVFVLRTLDDARAILERAQPGARCAVLGGGLLGLEAAGALAGRGLDVTVLEGYGYLLPRQLVRAGGELVLDRVRKRGIAVKAEVRAQAIEGKGAVERVNLGGGEELAVDMVLIATGIRPDTTLARRAGLTVKGGLIVDDRLATSDRVIYAAGDGTEHRGRVYGIWPASYAQAVVAGTNAAGGSAEFRGIPPANVLKVLDVDVFSIGDFEGHGEGCEVFEDHGEGIYRRLVCRDGRILGANLVGDTSLAKAVREAVEEGTSVGEHPQLRELFPDACSA